MKKMIRDTALITMLAIITYSLFGMLYPGKPFRKRSIPNPIHLVPTDADSMRELGLCTLFNAQEAIEFDVLLLEEMKADLRGQGVSDMDIENQLSSLNPVQGLKYHIFDENQSAFVEYSAPEDSPCIVLLGQCDEWNRFLIQYKSLDQFELAQKTGLSPALCAGHALNNACLMGNYAKTGEVKNLIYLHDLQRSANFLLDLHSEEWVNVEIVEKYIAQVKKGLTKQFPISAISSAQLFDSTLPEQRAFALFEPREYDEIQNIKEKCIRGLKTNNYLHLFIVGNEEFSIEHGHYFTFAIIKSGNTIQYVVLDTMPNVYHLQEGSHERNRLMFIIENIETGLSEAPLINMREVLYLQNM